MPDIFATNFTTLDWFIVGAYLAGAVILGMVVNRYIHSLPDYMVGGRASGTSLNVATYIGTGLGLVTIMYASIDGFNHGFSYMALPLIGVAVGLLLGTTGIVVCRLRRLRLLTIPEYFQRRYSTRVRVTAGIICATAGILNMGLFPKMGGTFITYATGLGRRKVRLEAQERPAASEPEADSPAAPQEPDTLSRQRLMVNIITSALIVLVLVYTVLGGMVSVIVTDYLQFLILSIGLGLGLLFCLTHPDLGWGKMVGTLAKYRGEAAFNPVHPDSYGWGWVFWMVALVLSAMVCWAPEASRSLTARDPKTAKRTFLLAVPGQFVRLAIPTVFAVGAYCYIAHKPALSAHFFPDGLAKPSPHPDAAMPLVLGKIVPTGLLGIVVAGLLAAFMSTHDSYFLCWSSVIVRDVVAPVRRRELSEKAQIRLTRIIIVLIGAFLLWWGIWYELPESVWTYMAVTGTVYLSGAGVVLIGGMYWRRASSAGAMAALLGGLVSVVGIFRDQGLHYLATLEPTTLSAVHKAIRAVLEFLTPPVMGLGNYIFCALLFVVFSLAFPDRGAARAKEA